MRRAVLLAAALALAACHQKEPPPSKDEAKLTTLREVLASRNDNDPRLDRDFNDLSSGAKRLFREAYAGLPAEARNERGTIVFLLGKNLREPEDWEFLRSVASEPPCLSLADCSKASSDAKEFGDDVTLAYPSLVALDVARATLEKPSSPSQAEALSVVAAARDSKMPAVQRVVASIDAQLAGRKAPTSQRPTRR